MALVLSTADQHQLTKALEALLSPLRHRTLDDWLREITCEIRPLFRGESTIAAYSSNGMVGHFSADAPELATRLSAATTFRHGELHFADPVMEKGLMVRRERKLDVFTSAILDALAGGLLRRSFFYNEVCRPFNARFTYGVALGGNDGEALIGVNAERPERDPLSEDTIALLSLLAPAFQAGFEMLRRLSHSSRALADAFEQFSDGMVVYDTGSGHELFRNTALQNLSLRDSDFSVVERRALELARALDGLHRRPSSNLTPRPENLCTPPLRDVRTQNSRYTLRASVLPGEMFARDQVVLVAIERHGVSLPTAETLRSRFGLTPREAQVALRLALGDGDADVAVRLGVSIHTARHHAEHIFEKLGVHSRKALALRLASAQN